MSLGQYITVKVCCIEQAMENFGHKFNFIRLIYLESPLTFFSRHLHDKFRDLFRETKTSDHPDLSL